MFIIINSKYISLPFTFTCVAVFAVRFLQRKVSRPSVVKFIMKIRIKTQWSYNLKPLKVTIGFSLWNRMRERQPQFHTSWSHFEYQTRDERTMYMYRNWSGCCLYVLYHKLIRWISIWNHFCCFIKLFDIITQKPTRRWNNDWVRYVQYWSEDALCEWLLLLFLHYIYIGLVILQEPSTDADIRA